jgi:hypothetical protein
MAIKRFWLILPAAALAFGMTLASCASSPLTKGFYSNVPVQVISEVNGVSSKTGEVSSSVWFGFFGRRSFPSISEAAQEGGITKVATVEYYIKPGILGLWTEYITIVTGE